jgi:23S rRNA pseudouridine2605 synthase
MRVRYGNLDLQKRLPQGAWIELDLSKVNQLRKMVQLPNETESVLNGVDEKLDHTRLSRMRRSVKKHKLNKVGQGRRNTAKPRTKK